MNSKAIKVFLGGLFAALVLSAAFAGIAGAAPAWKFEEKALEGSETILGGAEKSGMSVGGMTTTCDNFLYKITISNKTGTGEGSLTEVPLYTCYTNTVCTVEAIEAEALPWPTNLTTVSSKNYIIIKGVHVGILYGGKKCAVSGTFAEVEGSAGGLIDNPTETATFNSSSFSATGTKLQLFGGEPVEWTGVFPTEAFQWHRNQVLSVS